MPTPMLEIMNDAVDIITQLRLHSEWQIALFELRPCGRRATDQRFFKAHAIVALMPAARARRDISCFSPNGTADAAPGDGA